MTEPLLSWWQHHGRQEPAQKPWMFKSDGTWPLPEDSLSPYGIWIAEVMLQQTQLSVVLPYWQRWMVRCSPPWTPWLRRRWSRCACSGKALATTLRARRLHEAAQLLVEQSWPRDLDGWMALPGIGRTTAGGIVSSAFNAPAPILDGNVKRVLARLQIHGRPPSRDQHLFWRWSEELLDLRRPRDFNQALMDLGATVCTPRRPGCDQCPWRESCAAYASGDPSGWPVVEVRKPVPFQVIGIGVVINEAGDVLIDQRLEEGLLGGMWEFPGGKQELGEPIEACIARELMEELGIEVSVGDPLITVDHAYSHKKLQFVVHFCRWISGEPQPLASQQVRWVRPEHLKDYPFPAANARIIEALLGRLSRSNQLEGPGESS